jgi:hypothetical protein
MKRYSVRPATFADIDAVCSMIAIQNIADYGEAMVTTNEVTTAWQAMDLEHATCLAHAGGNLAGYGELRGGDPPFNYLADPSKCKDDCRFKKADACTPPVRKCWHEDCGAVSYLYKNVVMRDPGPTEPPERILEIDVKKTIYCQAFA